MGDINIHPFTKSIIKVGYLLDDRTKFRSSFFVRKQKWRIFTDLTSNKIKHHFFTGVFLL